MVTDHPNEHEQLPEDPSLASGDAAENEAPSLISQVSDALEGAVETVQGAAAALVNAVTGQHEHDQHDGEEGVSASDNGDDDADDEDEGDDAPESSNGLRRGEVLDGVIRSTTPTQILVDLPNELIGVINSRELERLDRSTLEDLQPGKPLTVFVVRASNDEGQPILSINRAKEEIDWRKAEEYEQSKGVYTGRIAGYNKGGLIVRFGRLRGFIPASQISQERERRSRGETPDERWGSMLNEEILVKVVEVNRSRNRLILSERAAARETRERQKEELINALKVGERYKGKVISLTDFGAFVDLGGADGLIHLTELSWKHITHPREVVEVGDEVEVKVISVDPERKRIGLSMKNSQEDPWEEVQRTYRVDQLVQGRITKLTRFGAFASLVDNADVEGLIHVSELADYRVDHPRDVVAVGDVLTLRVVKIDGERRRLGLSLKRVDSARYMESDWGVD